jgi:photosystem II stability/assembly factor-like uncharacterized protein
MKKSIIKTISACLALTVFIPFIINAQQVNWQRSATNVSGNIEHIAFGYDGSLYGVSDNAIVTSLDRGSTWRPLRSYPPLQGNERLTSVTVTNDNLLIVGTENRKEATGTIYASTDKGETWHYISGVAGDQTIRSLHTTPNGDVYLATYSNDSSYALYHLRYGAVTWEPIYRWTTEFPADVNTLTSDVKGNLYMMSTYGITVSRDQGESWYKLTPSVDEPYRSRDVSSTDSLVFSGMNDQGSERSKNAGYARNESISNFTTQRVTSLAVNSVGHIFAGTEFGGVYRTTNNGASWQQVTSGLTTSAVHSLNMTPGDTLYAGSFGTVFHSSHPTVDIKELAGYNPKGTFMESIYPNPAKTRVTIRYTLDKPSQISIAVFDSKGKKIMQLLDESKVSGIYELYPDIAGLPPGRYEIKLIAEDGFDMKPLVIVR